MSACTVRSGNDTLDCECLPADQCFLLSKDIEHLLLFPVRPCDIFTGKYLAVILLCYGIEILLLLPVCIIQTQYMGNDSVIITYISAAAILPHIVVFPLAVLVTICLKFAMLLKRMRHCW